MFLSIIMAGAIIFATGPRNCGDDECYRLTVECPNVEQNILAKVRVAGTGEAGTIAFFTGGSGTKYWGKSASASYALDQLENLGYQTVQVKWGKPGWLTSAPDREEGQMALACRPAAVIEWIHDNLHDSQQAFCATGNSAGAAQLGYALSHYGSHELLDAAVLTGGPPLSRVDLGCSDEKSDLSITRLSAVRRIDSGYGYSNDDGPCSIPTPAGLDMLYDNSINIGGEYLFPNTTMRFLFGSRDHSPAVAQGIEYFTLLETAGNWDLTLQVVTGAAHNVHKSQVGAEAIVDSLVGACR